MSENKNHTELRKPGGDPDRVLVARVQKGEKAAFDLLVRKYQHRILSLVGRFIQDFAEAEDVAQEVFIKAYRALPNFRGESAFYTWLYRIAVNTAKNHLSTQDRRPPGADIDAEEAEQFDGAEGLRDRDTPEDILYSDELGRHILSALDKLPPELRTAITLREIEGMSYEEIAVAMDCPIGTVRSRIFRARDAISKELEPLLGKKGVG